MHTRIRLHRFRKVKPHVTRAGNIRIKYSNTDLIPCNIDAGTIPSTDKILCRIHKQTVTPQTKNTKTNLSCILKARQTLTNNTRILLKQK